MFWFYIKRYFKLNADAIILCVQFEVRQTSVRPFVSDVYAVRRTDGRINIELPQPLLIVGDIKIEFIGKIKLLDIFNVSQR